MSSDSFHPGAARHGNFINYYEFNPPTERLRLLSDDLTTTLLSSKSSNERSLICLDIGCNVGKLTKGLYEHLCQNQELNCKFLAVDLDDKLIQRSVEENKYAEDITFATLDITEDDPDDILHNFLKKHNRKKFDLITCFSTTMWIHINNGDEGLLKFLRKISMLAEWLLIEPQPWKCYRNACRRMRKLKLDEFDISEIKIKKIDSEIKSFIENKCDMVIKKSYGSTTWGRTIYLFGKK